MASQTTPEAVKPSLQFSADSGESSTDGAGGEVSLLDLSFLTDEERVKIESVLQADQKLRTRDRIRLG